MKISIQIEISPEEVGLANEIVATLRQLTADVTVKQAGSTSGFFKQDGGSSVQMLQPGPQVPPPAPSASAAPGGAPAVTPSAPGAAVGGPPPPPPPPASAGGVISPEIFVPILNRLYDVPTLDGNAASMRIEQVGNEIKAVIAHTASPKEDVIQAFLQGFSSIVFSPELVHRQQPLLPFMEILPYLPESVFNSIRDKLISAVLKHLTIKRSLDADRAEFFAYAEAFAALVKLGTVSISGSVTTIITLMNKPENRCAAITMLGKTCDLCGDFLLEKCSEQELTQLRGAVEMIAADTNGPFHYDISYIKGIMGWGPQGA